MTEPELTPVPRRLLIEGSHGVNETVPTRAVRHQSGILHDTGLIPRIPGPGSISEDRSRWDLPALARRAQASSAMQRGIGAAIAMCLAVAMLGLVVKADGTQPQSSEGINGGACAQAPFTLTDPEADEAARCLATRIANSGTDGPIPVGTTLTAGGPLPEASSYSADAQRIAATPDLRNALVTEAARGARVTLRFTPEPVADTNQLANDQRWRDALAELDNAAGAFEGTAVLIEALPATDGQWWMTQDTVGMVRLHDSVRAALASRHNVLWVHTISATATGPVVPTSSFDILGVSPGPRGDQAELHADWYAPAVDTGKPIVLVDVPAEWASAEAAGSLSQQLPNVAQITFGGGAPRCPDGLCPSSRIPAPKVIAAATSNGYTAVGWRPTNGDVELRGIPHGATAPQEIKTIPEGTLAGSAIGAPAGVQVRVVRDDGTTSGWRTVQPSAWSPYPNATNAAQSTFEALLGRSGVGAGVEYWTDQIATGQKSLAVMCVELGRSPEYNEQRGPIWRLYQAAYGRTADQRGFAFWTAEYRSNGNTPAALERIARQFSASEEFAEVNGDGIDPVAIVASLWRNAFGRDGTPEELAGYVARLGTKQATVASTLVDIVMTSAMQEHTADEQFAWALLANITGNTPSETALANAVTRIAATATGAEQIAADLLVAAAS